MQELVRLKAAIKPHEILLVADAMTARTRFASPRDSTTPSGSPVSC